MQKYHNTALYLFCGIFLLISGFPAVAQYRDKNDDFDYESTYTPSKKKPGILHRPKQPTPAEQLAYADSLREKGRLKKAGKQYNKLVHHWHESPEAPTAQYAYADVLQERGKYFKAFQEYQYLVENFPGRFSYDDVLKKQFHIANFVMTARRFKLGFFPGFSTPDTAVEFFTKIVRNAPTWENAPKAQFNIGLTEEERGHYEEAARAYGVVQNRYGNTDYAPTAFYRRARCLYMAACSYPRDEQRNRNALSALASFNQRYINDPNEKEILAMMTDLKGKLAKLYYDRAYFYDKMKSQPLAALITYEDFVRNFPTSELTPKVNERIAELKQITAGMENELNETTK